MLIIIMYNEHALHHFRLIHYMGQDMGRGEGHKAGGIRQGRSQDFWLGDPGCGRGPGVQPPENFEVFVHYIPPRSNLAIENSF
jgi:hypothetical protein